MNDQVNNRPVLGYFLHYRYWNEAVALLRKQLELKQGNKHFNSLSMFYYEKLAEHIESVHNEEYFLTRVANNLLYGLESEFSVLPYPIPKSGLGLRNYKFMTLPMRIAYYAVALYLLSLSQEWMLGYYRKNTHIVSEYGGNLLFDDKSGELVLKYDSIWYKPHYRRFRKAVRREVEQHHMGKVVIHIDIQNYYDEISVPIMLKLIASYVKPSVQRQHRFDAISQSQIATFFEFLSNGSKGIPQSDNDITSSFLGHLYLTFADTLLDDVIEKENRGVHEHRIIRYMDDLYLVIVICPPKNCTRASVTI